MTSLVRLCLILKTLAWVVQAQECPGDGSDMVSRIKFKWHADSKIFAQPGDGEIDFLNNIPTLQDCANHCAINEKCQASVWDETNHDCRLISDTDGCQDGEPSHHSLWRVGFINDTDDNKGCSQSEVDAKCANKETAARLEAERECTIRNNDLQAEIARLQAENADLRAAKNQAERKLADTVTDGIEDQKRLNRQCQDKLNEEIERRRKAVKDVRDDAERNCRSQQANDLQKQRDELTTECDGRIKAEKADRDRIERQCDENQKRCADNYQLCRERQASCADSLSRCDENLKRQADDKEKLTQKCADDLSKANQQQKDSESKCNEAIRAKEDLVQQCNDNLNSAKNEQEQSENQCKVEKSTLQKDCDDSRNRDKTLLEARCEAEKDIINNQCTRDLDAAKGQLQQELESKCQTEKNEQEKQCNDRVVKEQKNSGDTCQREKDELQKDCEDRCQSKTRGKDDICYNPGFGAWPETLPPFDVDDTNYVLKANTNIWEGFSQVKTATSPASCAREYCNNETKCYAILWELNKSNRCRVFIDSQYSPFDKSRLQKFDGGYMIIKSDNMR